MVTPQTEGYFGAALTFEGGRSFESAPAEVLRLLCTDSPAPSAVSAQSAEIVRFYAVNGRIEHSADLSGLIPIRTAGLGAHDVLAVLARVASALSALHGAGQRSGDLGPWSIRVGSGGRVVLLVPPPSVPAGALVAARVRYLDRPMTDAAFCSGAALAGRGDGAADDVYALAGLAYWLLGGALPVGHIDFSAQARGPQHELARIIAASLAASSTERPPMAALGAALWRASSIERGLAGASGVQLAAAGRDQAQKSGEQQPSEGKQLSAVLTLLLAVGGLFVLVGALWIVAVGWTILGEIGRFGLLFVLTAGIVGAGLRLESKGYSRSGFALVVLGSQILWADGGYLLSLAGALTSVGAWAAVAAAVTSVSAALAWRRKSPGVGVIAALGFAVFALCFNVATGRPGQLAFFSALTAALALGGALALRRERPVAGVALMAVATRLLWIDAACCLDLLDLLPRISSWTVVAASIFAATLALASWRRSALAGLFASMDFMAFAALFSYTTGRPGQIALCLAVTATAVIAGLIVDKNKHRPLGSLLLLGAAQLLWVDAALILDWFDALRSNGAWTLASAVVLAATYAVTLWRVPVAGVVAALNASVFTSCLGALLSHGQPLGPPVYSLGVAWFYAGLAAVAFSAKKPGVSVPFALFGLLAAVGSASVALPLLADDGLYAFGALWPLAPLASLALFAFRDTGVHRTIARVGVGLLLALTPAAEAAARPHDPEYVVAAAILGAITVFAALRVPTLTTQVAGVSIGLINASLVPSVAFLGTCLDDGAIGVLKGPRALHLLSAIGAPLALLATAAFSRHGIARKEGYRMVELAALMQLFGLTTLGSLVRPEDFFYPGVILVTGALSLALGVARRHVVIVGIASGALLVNLWIQYFEKLRDAFPTAVLVIGFGLGLLVAGVIYERKVRHLLPRLREWG